MQSLVALVYVLANLLCVAVAKSQHSSRAGRIKLYTQPVSPPCRAVMMLARALELDLEIVKMDIMHGEQMKPEYLKINPQHSVPTIDDNGFILWESHAILAYFVNAYGKDDSLYPKNPQQRAVIDQRLYFDFGTLYSRTLSYFMPGIFNSEIKVDVNKIDEALGYLDKFVEGKSFVAGEHLSIADFAIVVTVSNLEAFDYPLTKFPNVMKWYERTKKALEPYGYVEINEAGANLLIYYIYGPNRPGHNATLTNVTATTTATTAPQKWYMH